MAFTMVFWAGPLACVGHPLVNYVNKGYWAMTGPDEALSSFRKWYTTHVFLDAYR
jgi:hypothetical protein